MHRQPPARVGFGPFQLDLRAGELRRNDRSVVLHQQPFQVLLMLVELDGEIATREEIKKKLWPNDTVVEFDHSINAAIKKLRRELDDSADAPKYIQTIARRGYRLMVPVTWIETRAPGNPLALIDAAPAVAACIPVNTEAGIGALTGKTVSHYRVLDIIGGGGMGLVYWAEDLKLGRAVALKFLPEEMGSDPRALERFEREARAVSALSHPNICPIFEFDDYEGQPFIVMELLRGLTLREHIAAGRFRLSDQAGLDIAIQIAAGLEAAHEKSIVHRDIKPANIFITEKNVAKILDFGVAKILEAAAPQELAGGERETDPASVKQAALNVTRPGLKLGTAGYMSPEQIRGEALDVRTDIFSFGLVLYEMATGERAFTGETEAMLHDAILNREPVPIRERASEVSPKLSIIVEKCLEKKREQRFQSAKEVRAALSDWQHDLLLVEPHATDEPESERPRRRYWLAAITFAAVLFAIVGGVFYRRAHPTPKLTDKDTIVLADFENKTGDVVFDNSLSTALRIGLEQTPFLNLLAPDKVTRVIEQMGHTGREPFTYERAKEVCARTNSAAVVTGSIADAGNEFQILARAVDCRSGETIGHSSATAQTRDVVVKVLGEVTTKLRRSVGEPEQTLRQFNQPLQEATSSSLEALRDFSLATIPGKQSEREALLGLQRAVQLDRNFAAAYLALARVYAATAEKTLGDDLVKSAYDLRTRMTQKQRLRVEAQYLSGYASQWEDAIRVYERWAETYPHDAEPRSSLSNIFLAIGDYERTSSEARAALQLDPTSSIAADRLMRAEMGLNHLAEARAIYEQHSQQLDRSVMRETAYEIGFLQHDTAFMQEQLKWLESQPGSQDLFFFLQAETEAFYGKLGRSSQLMDLGAEAAIRNHRPQTARSFLLAHAWRESEVGNFKRAQELTESVLRVPKNELSDYELTFAATTLARCGDVKGANAVLLQLKERFGGPVFVETIEIPNVRAAIQLAMGEPLASIEALELLKRKGHDLGGQSLVAEGYAGYLRGLAYMQASNPLQAVAEFQNIVNNPAEIRDFLTGPLAHLQLGRAQVMAGDKEAARKSYQEFLTLWKDADPDVPIYKRAKAEYAKLR